ncbi:2-amino-4-hydroxy-6-hydroxymethyldihydropteridine diphosphokinase [Bacillus suaedae]|uniref:2-amino-4-hydroxy-6-hydroxymethyldihydropteridine diphosphokinase n=1 Tax=Halalkalibacter suaedae TaxID=2822140 RepID=A0A941AQ36_9BACI|nr:2-amino-4-hydroxy-6-hydroxymethyldihydropteridine diphosphokinase [Bacillus suaedae]MBP3953455.1 2-amino-4-hydroxy-6-hydroxymethyldihydropteridine diphosphokinase [Bacillus suaedae]
MKHLAYIALGSNIGQREEYLERAILLLDEHERINVIERSSIYETDPVGYIDQQAFLNMVILVRTDLTAERLLTETQRIELECGRTREVKWGPRTIDLDILLFDQENMEMENLTIPHPRMWERAFVLVPLTEIAPTLYISALGKTILELFHQLPEEEGVRVWNETVGNELERIVSSRDIPKRILQRK